MGARIRQPCKSPECITRKWRSPRHAFFTFRLVGVRRQAFWCATARRASSADANAAQGRPDSFSSIHQYKCRRTEPLCTLTHRQKVSLRAGSMESRIPPCRSDHEYRHRCRTSAAGGVAARCKPLALDRGRWNSDAHCRYLVRGAPKVSLRQVSIRFEKACSGRFLTRAGAGAT